MQRLLVPKYSACEVDLFLQIDFTIRLVDLFLQFGCIFACLGI